MSERLYLYPLWVRIWHWINAIMFLALIATGISMQYSSPDYPIIRFDIAVTWHNIAGIILTVSFLFFVLFNWLTKNYAFYKIKKKGFVKRLMRQFNYYTVGLFRHENPPYPVNPKRKFNPMQKFSYVVVMYVLMPVMIITGLGLLYPETIIENVLGISGVHLTALCHVISAFALSVFLVIHLYFSTIGKTPLSNFKGMFTGWHEPH